MSQNQEYKLSEDRKRDLLYTVELSYTTITMVDGVPTEMVMDNQPVQIIKLQRRNLNHSNMAMDLIKLGAPKEHRDADVMTEKEIALAFARNCVYDKRQREDIEKDLFACWELYTSEAVQADFDRFFDSWAFLRKLKEESQSPQENR